MKRFIWKLTAFAIAAWRFRDIGTGWYLAGTFVEPGGMYDDGLTPAEAVEEEASAWTL